MANGRQSGFNLANVMGVLNEMLDAQERRRDKDASFELEKLSIQRDSYESDRDYRLDMFDKIKTTLDEDVTNLVTYRHGFGSNMYNQYFGSLYEQFFSEGVGDAGGFLNFVEHLKSTEVGFKPYDAGKLANIIYQAGSNPDDMSAHVSFLDIFKQNLQNPDATWEESLHKAGIAPLPVIKHKDGTYTKTNEYKRFEMDIGEFDKSHNELQRAKEKRDAYSNINPYGSQITNLADYDITTGMFDAMSDDDKDDDKDDNKVFDGGDWEGHFVSLQDMSPEDQDSYFAKNLGWLEPDYEYGDGKSGNNAGLAATEILSIDLEISELRNSDDFDSSNPEHMAELSILEMKKNKVERSLAEFQQQQIQKFKKQNTNDNKTNKDDTIINWNRVNDWRTTGRFYNTDHTKLKTQANKINMIEKQLDNLVSPNPNYNNGKPKKDEVYLREVTRYNENKTKHQSNLDTLRENFNIGILDFNEKHNKDFDATEFMK